MTNHREEIPEASPFLEPIAQESRKLCAGKQPTPTEAGLERSLDELMARVRDTTPISTTIQFDGWEPLESEAKAEHVLEIVGRAVDEALQSPGSTHIAVSLGRKGRRREVCICYDGGGHVSPVQIREETEQSRLAESIRSLDASFGAERRKSKGTTFRLTFQD